MNHFILIAFIFISSISFAKECTDFDWAFMEQVTPKINAQVEKHKALYEEKDWRSFRTNFSFTNNPQKRDQVVRVARSQLGVFQQTLINYKTFVLSELDRERESYRVALKNCFDLVSEWVTISKDCDDNDAIKEALDNSETEKKFCETGTTQFMGTLKTYDMLVQEIEFLTGVIKEAKGKELCPETIPSDVPNH